MLKNAEIKYMARQDRPLFGGHLSRGEPLRDPDLIEALKRGVIRQVGDSGYVLTRRVREWALANKCAVGIDLAKGPNGHPGPGPSGTRSTLS